MLELVNKLIFQWFFIRVVLCQQKEVIGVKFDSLSLLPDGSYGFAFRDPQLKIKYWYSLKGWISPFSGWGNDFKYIGKSWFVKITKEKYK